MIPLITLENVTVLISLKNKINLADNTMFHVKKDIIPVKLKNQV